MLIICKGAGEFEAGMSRDYGATRYHIALAKNYGLGLIVAVNKMDSSWGANWEQPR